MGRKLPERPGASSRALAGIARAFSHRLCGQAGLIEEKAAAGVIGKDERQKYRADIARRQAVALGRAGRPEAALAFIREALDSGFGKPSVQWDYIVLLSRAGHCQEAVSVFEILEDHSELPCYLLTAVADAYKETQQLQKSAASCQQCLERDPENIEAFAVEMNKATAKRSFNRQTAINNFDSNTTALELLRLATEILENG